MSSQFADCVEVVLHHEGGFVNNPKDRGKATNLGITIGTLTAWRGEPVTIEQVRNLTRLEARQIYMALYWNPLRCDDLPAGLSLSVFDFGVNAGPRRSAMMLQRLLAEKDERVEVDGAIGPITLQAVRMRTSRVLIEQFHDSKVSYYRSLESFPTFGKGWLNRASAVLEQSRAMAGYRVRD